MSDEEKLLLSWDKTKLVDDHVKDIQETLGEPVYPCEGQSEEEIRQEVCQDQAFFEVEWELIIEYLTTIMEERCPGVSNWRATVSGFGWRGQSGHKDFEALDGKALLQAILPDTDNTFWIYEYEEDGKKGFKINNCHHDSPIRGKEWYYIIPHEEKETKMAKKHPNSLYEAAEDIISIVGGCPYHYLGCDNMILDSKQDEFVETYLPWCNKPESMKIPGKCSSEAKRTTQLDAWKDCWAEYWSGKKRCVPPTWDNTLHNPILPKSTKDEPIEYADGAPCPKCDGTQIRRESDRGPFYGCINFPECKFLKPIKEETEPF